MKRFFLLFLFYIISLCFTSCSKFNLFSESKTPYHYEILKEINDTITNYPEIALELLKKPCFNDSRSNIQKLFKK